MTTALAIIGTVTGLLALALTARREWLDRPRLRVRADPWVDPTDASGFIVLTVENRGRRPATFGQVGLLYAEVPRPPWRSMGKEVWEITFNRSIDRARVEGNGQAQVRWEVPPDLKCQRSCHFDPMPSSAMTSAFGVHRAATSERYWT